MWSVLPTGYKIFIGFLAVLIVAVLLFGCGITKDKETGRNCQPKGYYEMCVASGGNFCVDAYPKCEDLKE